MTKLYDFRIMIRKAEYANGLVSVPYGNAQDVFLETCAWSTFVDALAQLAHLSGLELRSHSAFLSMKYRDDTKPRGFDKAVRTIYHDADDGTKP